MPSLAEADKVIARGAGNRAEIKANTSHELLLSGSRDCDARSSQGAARGTVRSVLRASGLRRGRSGEWPTRNIVEIAMCLWLADPGDRRASMRIVHV